MSANRKDASIGIRTVPEIRD
ncbi:MAG: hypothetical protein K0Q60_3254, partial [Microvirga sp.]|nr:hypothetical protein [Microvirga sp.]